MTTRSNTDPDDLLPLTDPEAIIQSGNAKQRRLKHLKSNPTIPLPPPSETTPFTAMSDKTPAHETSGSTRTVDASDMQTEKDWFKSVVGLLGWIDTVKYMYIKRSLEGEINCK
jgi:hypothetical protein